MRVSGNSTDLGVTRSRPDSKPASAAPSPAGPAPVAMEADALVVSSNAQFIAIAEAQVSGIPDVRMDKVEALKAMLDADDYNPDPEAVADGLVREHTPALRE